MMPKAVTQRTRRKHISITYTRMISLIQEGKSETSIGKNEASQLRRKSETSIDKNEASQLRSSSYLCVI